MTGDQDLPARRAVRLTARDGSIMYGGECGQPQPWRALITRTSRCAMLIGAIGLYANPGERAPTRITTLLDQAAHAEELVGAWQKLLGRASRGVSWLGAVGNLLSTTKIHGIGITFEPGEVAWSVGYPAA
jgi:hypothetical protein